MKRIFIIMILLALVTASASASTYEKKPQELPAQLASVEYAGPECWLLYESEYSEWDVNPKIYEIYAKIEPKVKGWENEVKTVLKMFIEEFCEYEDVIIKVFNDMDNEKGNQPTYQNLIALWESEPFSMFGETKPRITWYSSSLPGGQKNEEWNP